MADLTKMVNMSHSLLYKFREFWLATPLTGFYVPLRPKPLNRGGRCPRRDERFKPRRKRRAHKELLSAGTSKSGEGISVGSGSIVKPAAAVHVPGLAVK